MNHGQICAPDAYTKVLLHFNGADGSTTFTDDGVTGHTVTPYGAAQLTTSDQVFGSACGTFNGVDSYLKISNHPNFDFSGGVWTIDWRQKANDVPSISVIFYHETDANNYMMIHTTPLGSGANLRNGVRLLIVTGGVTKIDLVIDPGFDVGRWRHYAFVENGDDFYGFCQGYLEDSVNSTDRPLDYSGDIFMFANATPVNWFNGKIDEFRISDTARWTSDFAVPSIPYPTLAETTPAEDSTTYAEGELSLLQYSQSADTMWVVHGSHKPAKLTRSGHANWSLADITFTSMPDWDDSKGWPQTCAFFEQRFCYAGSKTYPQIIWMSKSADYDNFAVSSPIVDDDACEFYIPADRVDRISWLLPISGYLFVGTAGGEIKITGADTGITPTNISARNETYARAANIMAVRVKNVGVFIQWYGLKIHELVYFMDEDSYRTPDLTIMAEHITEGGIKYIAYQQEPYSMIWAVRADGQVPTLTYLKEEEVIGWARQFLGDGNPEVESVAVIPDPAGAYDEVWASVKFTMADGTVKRYIGYFDPDMNVDLGITYSGPPVTVVSGLDHLEGSTVDIVGDDLVYPQAVVTSGSVTLDGPAASEISVGLPYTSKIVSMKATMAGGAGTTAGLPRKWAEVYVSLLESRGVTINGEVLPFATVGDVVGAAIVPFTGEKKISNLGWEDSRITIEQTQPLPCTIRGIYGTVDTGEG